MKNILVISQSFAPKNAIASIRFTKMVKYLARTGEYHFWVVCVGLSEDAIRDELLQRDIEEVAEYVTVLPVYMNKKLLKNIKGIFAGRKASVITDKGNSPKEKKNLYYAIQNNFVMCRQEGMAGSARRWLGRLMLAVNDVYDLIYETRFAYKGAKISKQIPINEMDAMISTYPQIGGMLLALKFKKGRRDLKWIVDYRDPVRAKSIMIKKIMSQIALRADMAATHIVGASKSYVGSGKQLRKFHMILNSYDKEDLIGICSVQNEKLTICYTGSLYIGKQDMTLLFRIIHELGEEGKLNKERIRIVYAGAHYHVLKNQVEKFGLDAITDNRGKVSRKESLQIQKQSDILCALTWNNIGDDDVIPGKVLEYFMMEKPIFAIASGDKPDSILKHVMMKANIGYCLEEAECEKYYEEAKKWFLDKYLEFIENGQVVFEPNEKEIEKYSSENMAKRFGMLIEKC